MAHNRFPTLFTLLTLITASRAGYIPPGPRFPCPVEQDEIRLIHPCTCDKGSDAGLYVSCENVGIATLSVGLGNLATLGVPVEELVIRECNIARLYGTLFHRLQVRILKILDTPITKIEAETFYGVNKTLQNFQLVNSHLSEFPKDAFNILGNLTYLYINHHHLKTLDKKIFSDSLASGKLERLHLINGELEDLPFESFQPLRKLKTLDLHGNNLTVLKKTQFKGLRDIEVLDISFNNITKLESSHIADLTKLTWCNVSHNHLTEMSRGMFARNSVLKVLHMDNNKLKKLDTNSFRGMRFLRRLFLSDNLISDIGRGTFASITKIGTIDLARNKLKKIDFQMFYKFNLMEFVDVSSNEITEIQKQSFGDLYLCKINISHNALSKIEVGAFENCANITVLDLSYNNLTQISPRVFDENTYATEFQLSHNYFTALNQVPIHNMTGLKVLNVSNNLITSIPRNTFPKLYELHTVDVSYNQLTDIASAVFQTLFSLRNLNLSHNSLEQIKPPTFGTLPTLLELDLSHNLLRDISKGALTKLASCRILDVSHNFLEKIFTMPISLSDFNLSYNNISSLPANIWPTMNALLKLDLSNNPIGEGLSSSSFSGLLTLQTLVLTNTSITRPPWEALNVLSSLQYLKLNQNNITALNKGAFGRLPIVFDLDLSDNQITNITQRSFDGLLQLLALSLRNNNLTHIPNEAFRGLVSLRTLDLSQNSLEKLDNRTNGLLDDLLSIENVNLSYNKISFITRKTFPNDPYIPYKLKNIDLSHNEMPVITGDILFGTKKLEVLNMSHNIINDFRNGVIGNLSMLRVLDLSSNHISDISSEKTKFRLPKTIEILNLSYNSLLKLPIEHIQNSTNLTMLDVRNNSLQFFDHQLVTMIKRQGLNVSFSGNPLKCDCFARPLKRYLNHLSKSGFNAKRSLYSDITCSEPSFLQNIPFFQVEDNRLNCIENVAIRAKLNESTNAAEDAFFDSEPDLIFRDVQFSQENIMVKWFVLTSKDVGNFQIIVKNTRNDLFYARIVSYNKRELTIPLEQGSDLTKAIKSKADELELCILSGNSETETFNWFESQCAKLPRDFDTLPKQRGSKHIRISDFESNSSTTNTCNISFIFIISNLFGALLVKNVF